MLPVHRHLDYIITQSIVVARVTRRCLGHLDDRSQIESHA
jgi:hypothetical protein